MKLRRAETEEFDRIYAILEASFPRDEYRGYEAQYALLRHPAYTIYVAEVDGGIGGWISVWALGDFAFVEHFAVDPARRGQGLGTAILSELRRRLACRICLEVEPPVTEQARRRIGFYERNGFFLNDYPYEQPAYGADRSPVPLLIMTTEGGLSEAEFATLRATLYRDVYGIF